MISIILSLLIESIRNKIGIRQLRKDIINVFCIPITFNNPIKVCISNKKYPITNQTRQTQIVKVYFVLKNRFFVHKITFCSDLMCNKALKARNAIPTPFISLLHVKSEQKVIRK